ncbi:unnamed protein product [Fusarium graminearum]|uniref:Uncharacterized protein n=1 Tax=Gibberella zeae TaxID=5518 RepID=A0A9N8RJM0_GIBZA|nr:unnamed protein product [Fusarium graminearum]CAF3607992.1 unnamed protein product [Fusarium graminearum]CAG1997138.1 unnamed protein product [Fusarium graminearum]
MCPLLQLQVEMEAVELMMEWAWLVLAAWLDFWSKASFCNDKGLSLLRVLLSPYPPSSGLEGPNGSQSLMSQRQSEMGQLGIDVSQTVETSGYGNRSQEINGTVARYLCVIAGGIFPIWTPWFDDIGAAGANFNPVDRPDQSRSISPGSS